MRARPLILPVTLGLAMLLGACTPVSITGPCEVTSNSTITLDIGWSTGVPPNPGIAQASIVTKMKRPQTPRPSGAQESVLILVEAPVGWTPTTAEWEGTIGGSPASGTAVMSDTPTYCTDAFGTVRAGYERKYFLIAPDGPLGDDATGILHVTYDTSSLDAGIYYPLAMATLQTDTEVCLPNVGFHRVTAGSTRFVQFDVAQYLNADVVVNNGTGAVDPTQDPFAVVGGVPYAMVTQSVAGEGQGLPDNGFVDPAVIGSILKSQPLVINTPDCLPAVQLRWSNEVDGVNAWIPNDGEPSLTFDVPPAYYAELQLFLTGLTSDNVLQAKAQAPVPDAAVQVTLTYDGPSTDVITFALPPAGWPLMIPSDTPGLATVPTFTIAMSELWLTDGSLPSEQAIPAGITAALLSPDPTKILTSVKIEPVQVQAPVSALAVAAEPAPLTFFDAAAVALAPDLTLAKTVLTPAPIFVGQQLTYRLTVTNGGDAGASGVTLSDALPAQTAFVSANTANGSCSFAAGTVTCTIDDLAPGASTTVDIVVQVNASGAIVNSAEVTGTGDSNIANNAAEAAITAAANGATDIPTASTWAMLMMAATLIALALLRMRG